MVSIKTNNYKFIDAKPFAPNLGADIYGVDLSKPIPEEQFVEIHQAFLDYQVLFFKNQGVIPPDQHILFGKRFDPDLARISPKILFINFFQYFK